MLSNEVIRMEQENKELRAALKELADRMEKSEVLKPRSCQYCRNYIQHYMKTFGKYNREFVPVYAGHCVCNVPGKRSRVRKKNPDDTCPYFEIGVRG